LVVVVEVPLQWSTSAAPVAQNRAQACQDVVRLKMVAVQRWPEAVLQVFGVVMGQLAAGTPPPLWKLQEVPVAGALAFPEVLMLPQRACNSKEMALPEEARAKRPVVDTCPSKDIMKVMERPVVRIATKCRGYLLSLLLSEKGMVLLAAALPEETW